MKDYLMKGTMNFFAMMVAVFFSTSGTANAWYSIHANKDTIDQISVHLIDRTEGLCWTNLRESREYAEEKLGIVGYNVTSDIERSSREYRFEIEVAAFRSDNQCVGHYTVNIGTANKLDGLVGMHLIGTTSGYGVNPENFNEWVLELIARMVDSM